ncbi:Uncharacterised protein [Legionella beliardensis]|uniref:Uncharacterized protein n=1 Tax=Legionella beliardensis TaxID=91822 RepID=A0A378HZ12_9GAMM|nr:hypothetical protein [Legionella beliardensis]STX28168.1 Uncharacterised protein [Legionella beliardensis]
MRRDSTNQLSLNQIKNKIFFCGLVKGRPIAYAKDAHTADEITQFIKNEYHFNLKVKLTASLKFEKATSLEDMIKGLQCDEILLDPTGILTRATALLHVAREVRLHYPKLITGCYFNSEQRIIHFVLRTSNESNLLAEMQNKITAFIKNATFDLSFLAQIQISYFMPQGKLIAIDKKSAKKRYISPSINYVLNKLKVPLLLVSASSAQAMSEPVLPPEPLSLPAISRVNAWIEGSALYLKNRRIKNYSFKHDNNGKWGGFGRLAGDLPLTHSLGLQIEGLKGGVNHQSLTSVEGILFWRNPAYGLLGPRVDYTDFHRLEQYLYAAHGEGYFNTLTIRAEGGGISAHCHGRDQSSGYAELDAHWYVMPNLDLNIGGAIAKERSAGQVGFEFQPGLAVLPGLSVLADFRAGDHNLRYASLGLRYYFADTKSLIRRHREDMVLPSMDLLALEDIHMRQAPQFHS